MQDLRKFRHRKTTWLQNVHTTKSHSKKQLVQIQTLLSSLAFHIVIFSKRKREFPVSFIKRGRCKAFRLYSFALLVVYKAKGRAFGKIIQHCQLLTLLCTSVHFSYPNDTPFSLGGGNVCLRNVQIDGQICMNKIVYIQSAPLLACVAGTFLG